MTKANTLYAFVALLSVLLLFTLSFCVTKLFLKDNTFFANKSTIALIEVKGMIVDSSETIKQLHFAKDESSIKAVVLRIDTPGGVVGPTQEIYEEVVKLKKSKPIIVSMGSIAASGGYYIAAPADIIFANPGTITGSIGVLMKLANVQALLEKIGVYSHVLKSGEFKDSGSPVKNLTARDKIILQGIINSMHEQFVLVVADGRKIPIQKVRQFADGRIYTGQQAQKLKLIDKLGNLQDAIDEAASVAGIKQKPKIVYPPQTKKNFIDLFMKGFTGSLVKSIKSAYETTTFFEYSLKTDY
ncbi:MAG: signal peptide peptidase SppA [Geobacteraceae bacterium]